MALHLSLVGYATVVCRSTLVSAFLALVHQEVTHQLSRRRHSNGRHTLPCCRFKIHIRQLLKFCCAGRSVWSVMDGAQKTAAGREGAAPREGEHVVFDQMAPSEREEAGEHFFVY